MNTKSEHIHPIFSQTLSRTDKERLLGQKGAAIWLIGLSGSGKSTVAKTVERLLHEQGYYTMLLDGDNLRTGINNNLGFSEEDRKENIRRTAEVTRLFVEAGAIAINSFITPTEAMRSIARLVIGENNYHEIYIECPLEVCETRDVKGLYKKARAGEIKDFTGIHSPFETPKSPSLVINTARQSLEESARTLYQYILKATQGIS